MAYSKKKTSKKKKKPTLANRAKAAGRSNVGDTNKSRAAKKGENWVPPDDMPKDMVEAVRAGKMCGARKKGGGWCRGKPHVGQRELGRIPPLRCRHHGGTNPGAPSGNTRAVTHGMYARAVLPGEHEAYESADISSLDEEIRITKLRLRRALEHEAKIISGDMPEWVKVERTDRAETGEVEKEVSSIQERNALREVQQVITGIINQLTRLYNQRAQIMAMGEGDSSPEERAQRARKVLANMRATVEAEFERGSDDDE